MKCPHCTVEFHDNKTVIHLGKLNVENWGIAKQFCPKCEGLIIELFSIDDWDYERFDIYDVPLQLIYPKDAPPRVCPPEVPKDIAEDFQEACLVLPISPKASAALSRRCLQNVLVDAAKVQAKDLAPQIQEVIDSKALPTYLSESIDAIRNIGNYAAHPNKCQQSGVIVKVEPHEAEWNLDV